ncbi:MAG: hypothetical protein ABIH92_03805 [Nanoarchaeota archaeon]
MNNDLVAGLRNAISHGSSLDEAINSFISAGYNSTDVREAAQLVGGGASQIAHPLASNPPQKSPTSAQQLPSPPQSNVQQNPPSPPTQTGPVANSPNNKANPSQISLNPSQQKKSSWLPWIIVYLIALVLILVGGLVIWIYFPDLIPYF